MSGVLSATCSETARKVQNLIFYPQPHSAVLQCCSSRTNSGGWPTKLSFRARNVGQFLSWRNLDIFSCCLLWHLLTVWITTCKDVLFISIAARTVSQGHVADWLDVVTGLRDRQSIYIEIWFVSRARDLSFLCAGYSGSGAQQMCRICVEGRGKGAICFFPRVN